MTVDATGPAEPVSWPAGHRAAAVLSFDMDAEETVLSIDRSHGSRLSVMSHQAYGPLVGVPRILRLLARHEVRATFFCPGWTAERYPDVLRAVVAGGHEVAHHGYLHESVRGMTPAQEAETLDRGLEALERVTGRRPVGYRAPMWETTYSTPGLLAARGFAYDSSLMDADVPYLLAEHAGADARTLVEIPVQWALDDWEQYGYLPEAFGSGLIEDPAKVLSMWTGELAACHAEGLCFTLTCHPFLSGRPGRAQALERLVETMRALPDLWVATGAEVAAHVRTLPLTPRAFTPPTTA